MFGCTEMVDLAMAQTADLLDRKPADMSMQEKMLHKIDAFCR